MKIGYRYFILPAVTLAILIPSCIEPLPPPGPHRVATIGVGVGYYDTLPGDYADPYYFYGNRYYYGGVWEPGHFYYSGRYYDGRYLHRGHYLYGGRYETSRHVTRSSSRHPDRDHRY